MPCTSCTDENISDACPPSQRRRTQPINGNRISSSNHHGLLCLIVRRPPLAQSRLGFANQAAGGLVQSTQLGLRWLRPGELHHVALTEKLTKQLLVIVHQSIARLQFKQKLLRRAIRCVQVESALEIDPDDQRHLGAKLFRVVDQAKRILQSSPRDDMRRRRGWPEPALPRACQVPPHKARRSPR